MVKVLLALTSANPVFYADGKELVFLSLRHCTHLKFTRRKDMKFNLFLKLVPLDMMNIVLLKIS